MYCLIELNLPPSRPLPQGQRESLSSTPFRRVNASLQSQHHSKIQPHPSVVMANSLDYTKHLFDQEVS